MSHVGISFPISGLDVFFFPIILLSFFSIQPYPMRPLEASDRKTKESTWVVSLPNLATQNKMALNRVDRLIGETKQGIPYDAG